MFLQICQKKQGITFKLSLDIKNWDKKLISCVYHLARQICNNYVQLIKKMYIQICKKNQGITFKISLDTKNWDKKLISCVCHLSGQICIYVVKHWSRPRGTIVLYRINYSAYQIKVNINHIYIYNKLSKICKLQL